MGCHRMTFITLTLISVIKSCLIASDLITKTYKITEPDGSEFYCNYCPKGTHWTGNCVSPNPISKCTACPEGRFQDISNKALSCEWCLEHCPDYQGNKDPPSRMVVVTNCTVVSDLKCQCDAGYYWSPAKLCLVQDACEAGSGVVAPGTPQHKTKCAACHDGQTFSPNSSLTETCQPCSTCPEGLLEKLPCTRTNDTVCHEKHDDDGLSDGAIVGIVVGVVMAIVVLIVLIECIRRGKLTRLWRKFFNKCDESEEDGTAETNDSHDIHRHENGQVDHDNATNRHYQGIPMTQPQGGNLNTSDDPTYDRMSPQDICIYNIYGDGNQVNVNNPDATIQSTFTD